MSESRAEVVNKQILNSSEKRGLKGPMKNPALKNNRGSKKSDIKGEKEAKPDGGRPKSTR